MDARIAIIGGDGIGPEVISVAERCMNAIAERFGHNFQFTRADAGGRTIDSCGDPLPPETLDIVRGADATLFGAVGGPEWDSPDAERRPEESILGIRKSLKLFANIRPVKAYPQLAHASPLRPDRLRGVNMIIVRELTGGLYFGSPKKRWRHSRGRSAVDTLFYTEKEIARVARLGFELAMQRRKRLHSVDKMNVLESGRLWREVVSEIAEDEYPEVEMVHMLVDNAAMQLISDPSQFDVLITENTFGDILSDEAAVLSGSMGMLPSASLAGMPVSSSGSAHRMKQSALYEPIHGSAPDIAGRGLANPSAAVLSAAMLLRFSFGLHEEADAIEEGIEAILDEGVRTADISRPGDRVYSTAEFEDFLIGHING